jgi:hypothetical protein
LYVTNYDGNGRVLAAPEHRWADEVGEADSDEVGGSGVGEASQAMSEGT